MCIMHTYVQYKNSTAASAQLHNTGMMQLLTVQSVVVPCTAQYGMLCTPVDQPCFCLNGGQFDDVIGSCVCLQGYTGAHCGKYNGTGDY